MRAMHWSAALAAAVAVTATAHAGIQTFILEWSGESFQNGATATGTISIDFNELSNPGFNSTFLDPFVTAFSITVTGSSNGDGAWDLDDFDEIILNTNAETGGGPAQGDGPGFTELDFTRELIGQPTAIDPWGTSQPGGTGGDFNIFAKEFNEPSGIGGRAPHGTYFFEITVGGFDDATGEGPVFGEQLLLTSFRPIPTPGSATLAGLAAFALGARRRR